ncbi:MAG: MmcQ/YjbR family DNA-binding protein [Lachnospiraceae bacterium]|nr:MmcQ/YjbR family DNA-binding protein [Lachnospiraceae bacterium]
MTTRKEALEYGMSFENVYMDTPFRDDNWVLVRSRKNKKAFLWTYEYEGQMRINVKADPEWRDFWRNAFESVLPGYHQNKEHWNTVILDGTIPDDTIKRMIAESYDLVMAKK